MLALAVMGSGMLSSCTDDFEDLNTNKTQVDPGDLPFAAQCAEAMNYCYAPHQNMFQFWTNLTIDLYGGYFQTPHGNFTNCDMGENRGHSGGMYENYYLHIFNNTRRNITNLEKQSKPGLAATMRIVQAVGTMQLPMLTDRSPTRLSSTPKARQLIASTVSRSSMSRCSTTSTRLSLILRQ